MMSNIQNVQGLVGIPTRIDTTYLQKARGTITAKSESVSLGEFGEKSSSKEFQVTSNMYNSRNEIVATTTVTWLVKLKKLIR